MSEVEWMDIFGHNLVSLLDYTYMTQRDLADASGLSESSVTFYIKKKFMPNLKSLINMAHVLDIDIDEFINFDDYIK